MSFYKKKKVVVPSDLSVSKIGMLMSFDVYFSIIGLLQGRLHVSNYQTKRAVVPFDLPQFDAYKCI